MKVYIAGPMRGYENYNFDAFDKIDNYLTARGHCVVSPAAIDRLFEGWEKYPPKDAVFSKEDIRRFMERDMNAISGCDTICMMKGWEKSKGACLELAYAEFLGLVVLTEMESL